MIRPYVDDDLDALLAVWERASRIAHHFLDDAFFERERRAIVHDYLPITDTFVCESDGRLIGFIALLGDTVGAVFVDPDAQRRGVGRALLDHVRTGRRALFVDVFERNAVGRAFYDGCGFTLDGSYRHDETGETMLRLRLAGDGGVRGT